MLYLPPLLMVHYALGAGRAPAPALVAIGTILGNGPWWMAGRPVPEAPIFVGAH